GAATIVARTPRHETPAFSGAIPPSSPDVPHFAAPGSRSVKPTQKTYKLLILIPAFNESGAIANVVREVRETVPGAGILVVDDASKDETVTRATAAGAGVLRLPYHLGLGGCVQAGYRLAYELGYDYVIRVDGDGQHDPRYIAELLKVLRTSGCHMVIGSRFY